MVEDLVNTGEDATVNEAYGRSGTKDDIASRDILESKTITDKRMMPDLMKSPGTIMNSEQLLSDDTKMRESRDLDQESARRDTEDDKTETDGAQNAQKQPGVEKFNLGLEHRDDSKQTKRMETEDLGGTVSDGSPLIA